MDEPPVPGDTHLHRYEIHKRVADRLRRTVGITEVEAEPSPMPPVRVRATVDTDVFADIDRSPSAETSTLEIEWRPRPNRDEFRIQYNEPGTPWSGGWHQDGSHADLDPSHFQVNHEDWEVPHRETAPFTDQNSMAILEICLDEFRKRVPTLPDDFGNCPSADR